MTGGEERLEQLRLMVRGHTGAVVEDFKDWQLAVGVDEQLKPDLCLVVVLGAVAPAVANQVVENLVQLVRVHQGLEVSRSDVQMNLLALGRALAGFSDELLQPRFQVQPLRHGLLAAGQLQDVFDDSIHALGVILNDLGQTLIRAVEFLRFAQ
ncbi:hypothetical protein D3C87_1232740 [compost metagenome]